MVSQVFFAFLRFQSFICCCKEIVFYACWTFGEPKQETALVFPYFWILQSRLGIPMQGALWMPIEDTKTRPVGPADSVRRGQNAHGHEKTG